MSDSLNTRARKRVREALDSLKVVQNDIAGQLHWSQSKVAQKLGGRTPWTLDELEALCFIAGILPSEAVRDPGLEFCAEMAPYELRVLSRLRGLDDITRAAFLQLLDVKVKLAQPDRYATPVKNSLKARVKK